MKFLKVYLFLALAFVFSCDRIACNQSKEADADVVSSLNIVSDTSSALLEFAKEEDILNERNGVPQIEASSKRKMSKQKEDYYDSLYKEKLKVKLEKSVLREKSCSDIINEFSKLVVTASKANDLTIFFKSGWDINDPVLQNCLRTDTSFQRQFYELDKKLSRIK